MIIPLAWTVLATAWLVPAAGRHVAYDHWPRGLQMQSDCGSLRVWRLPESTVVEATPQENRPYKVLVTQARINIVVLAAERYCVAHSGAYPGTFAEMIEYAQSLPRESRKCLLVESLLSDAWEQPLFYALSSGIPVVMSAGQDGRFTTEDDIGMPRPDSPKAEPVELERQCV